MVAQPVDPAEPTRRSPQASQRSRTRLFREAPLLWRVLLRVDRALILLTGRLEVTGDVPDELRGRPLLLASNHIGNVDALVVMAACGRRRLALRFLATGGLFDAPVIGSMLRHCHHVRADRGKANAAQALDHVVGALEEDHRPVLVYPEGRISLEPGLWPERGKTGVARMALASRAPVIPISQWGAHEAMCYGMLRVGNFGDVRVLLGSWLAAIRRRPVLKVHFGDPVDLSDLSSDRAGDAARARDRIMRAITAGLAPLRADEPDVPRHEDPTRKVTDKRSPWRP
ncbi:lysophospholipid acyltransferase family protein [Saccharopolyspora sp. NPDC002578]